MFFKNTKLSPTRRIAYMILPVLSLALLVFGYAAFQQTLPNLLPNGIEIWERFISTFTNPIKDATLIGHIQASLYRVLIALLFAWVLGISFGVMIGWSRLGKAVFGSIFELFRPVPPIAWIPIIIMWFGIGEFSKILIVFIGSFIPVVINTEAGIRLVEKEYVDVGRLFGANRMQLLKEFVVPTALPSIFAGVRTSVSCAWTVVLAAEMMGADLGIGALVTRGWNNGDMALVFVSIICIGIIGAILAFVLNKMEKVVCPWNS